MADSTLSNLTSLTLPSQATDLLLVGRGTARPNKVAMSDALNSAALAATTSTYGVAQLAADGGTTAGTVVQATDARLSNARNPPDGSKGDIVVSGSGSTWTIKTNPTLSGTVSADIVRVGDGTAAAPSLSFTNDSNTGFYKVAAATDVLYFAANGGGSLRFTTNGSIYSGVNNSYLQLNPSGDIYASVDGTSNGSLVLEPRGTGNVVIRNLSGIGNRTRLEIAQSGLRVFHLEVTGATADLAFGDGGGEYFRLAANSGYSVLFGKTATSNNGRIQLADHTTTAGGIGFGADISLSRSASAQLDLTVSSGAPTFRFMNGAVYRGYVGTNGATTVLNSQSGEIQLQTSNAIALLLSANQNATFYKDVFLGSNGPSVPGTLSARAPRQGLVFDGSASANASTVAAIGSGDYTVHVVFKAESPTTPLRLVQVGQSGVAQGFQFGTTDSAPAGRLVVRNGDASAQLFGSTVLTANRWYAATAVRASGVVTIYLNGQGEVTGSLATNYSNGTGGMTIHGSPGNYAGTVETAIIYNRALSQDEVRQLYETGVPAASDINSASNTAINTSAFTNDGTFGVTYGTFSGASATGFTAAQATATPGMAEMKPAFSSKVGKRYRVSFTATLVSGLAPVFQCQDGSGNQCFTQVTVTNGTNNFEVTLNGFASGTITTSFYTGGATSYAISGFSMVPLGAVLAPDANQRGSYLTWYDTSGNNNHITLPSSGVTWNVPASPILNLVGTPTTLSSFVNMYVTSLAGGDSTGGRMTWFSSGTGNVETGFLQVTQASGFGGTFSIGLNTTNSGTASTVFQIKKNGNTLLGTTTDGGNGRLQLADHTTLTGGIGLGSGTAIYNDGTAGVVRVQKVGGGGFGALHLYSDTQLRASLSYNATDGYVDAPVGNLIFRTSGTVTALTINSSQNSVFAGNVAVQGSVSSDGVNGNALFGGAKRVIIGYDTTADIGNIAAVHTGTAWKPLALQPVSGAVLIGKTTDTGNGRLQFLESTTAQNGIQFGTDTNLYRSAANTLKTDDVFQAAGGMSSGSYVGGQDLYLNNAAGTVRAVYWQTAGVSRWALYTNNTAESGSNLGSNLTLSRYTDAGAYVGDPLSIDRATGTVLFGSASVAQTLSANGQVGMTVTNNNAGTNAFAGYQIWNGTTGLNLITWGSAFTGRTNESWIYSVGAYPLRFGTDSTIRMMLTGSTGNLLIGTAVDGGQKLQVAGTMYASTDIVAGSALRVVGNATYYACLASGTALYYGFDNASVYVRTNSTVALTIDSNQNGTFAGSLSTNKSFSTGAGINAACGIYVQNTALTGTDQFGLASEPVWTSSAQFGHAGWFRTKTAAASYTLTAGRAIYVEQPTLGAGSSITSTYGLQIRNQGATGVTNAYGVYVESQSGASSVNYAIYTAGGRINFQGLPTSSAGLPAGTLWNDAGTLKVA